MEVTVEGIIEDAIIQLEIADRGFSYLWEQHFAWTNEPESWKNGYHGIAAHVTAYKILLNHITERLLAASSMSNEYHKAELKVLHEANNKEATD